MPGSCIVRTQQFTRALGKRQHCVLVRRPHATVGRGDRSLVQGPPDDYNWRSESLASSTSIVCAKYPELLDLVEQGTLIVVPRSQLYRERRTDGYVEPEEIYILGTAHLSRESAKDVQRVVNAVQPENVVVELCKSRAALLYQPQDGSAIEQRFGRDNATNLLNLSGSSLPSAFLRALSLGGRNALILRILLAGISDRLSKQAGVVSGVEFRAAQEAADQVGAQVVLGDRPIEITLQRAWSGLDLRSKTALLWDLFRAARTSTQVQLTQQVVEQLKQDDIISAYFNELGRRYPQLMSPLIHERDLYLAWSLKRSKAVGGTARVVGVVGKGHLRGVVYALTHDNGQLRFKDLVGSREAEGSQLPLVLLDALHLRLPLQQGVMRHGQRGKL